jgi:nucleoside-diphosphate-sugar epimerase
MSRVLVIGSEGNVGRPLVARLWQEHDVWCADREPGWRDGYSTVDLLTPLDLAILFAAFEPQVVYLLAAMVSRVTCEASASMAYSTNLAGVGSVATLCRAYEAKLIFVSSSEVYGPDVPMREDETPRPNNRYGLTKWLGEQIVNYERSQGLRAVIVRPTMLYSENETTGDHRSAMIRFADHLSRGEAIEVHEGTSRAWMHMDDGVEALARCLGLEDGTLNIGHPVCVSTLDLAQEIANRLGASHELIRVVSQPAGMTPIKAPNLDRQREWLGFEPTVGIEEGVRRVCERFR